MRILRRGFSRISAAALLATLLVDAWASAGEQSGKVTAVHGTLLARGDGGWTSLKADAPVSGTATLVALFGAKLQSANDAVELRLLADVGHRGPLPVLESGVTLRPPAAGADMDVALDRGLILIGNKKKSGAAKVHLRLHGEEVDVTLKTPGAKLAVEVYGRHVPGFGKLDIAKEPDPVVSLYFFMLEGEAYFSTKEKGLTLTAPAVLQWDTLLRTPAVQRLDKLPEYAKAMTAAEKDQFDKLCACVQNLGAKDPGAALAKLVQSGNKAERMAGVTGLGAVDDLPRLFKSLGDEKHGDVREQAVLVLRNWAGRQPGQLGKLHKTLTDKGASAAQAKTLVRLLIGFDNEERRSPDTYQFLIGLLEHGKVGVRELAHWHLVRLWTAGKDIPYDAAGSEDSRRAAVARWRAAIPAGQLPPPPPAPTPSKVVDDFLSDRDGQECLSHGRPPVHSAREPKNARVISRAIPPNPTDDEIERPPLIGRRQYLGLRSPNCL